MEKNAEGKAWAGGRAGGGVTTVLGEAVATRAGHSGKEPGMAGTQLSGLLGAAGGGRSEQSRRRRSRSPKDRRRA